MAKDKIIIFSMMAQKFSKNASNIKLLVCSYKQILLMTTYLVQGCDCILNDAKKTGRIKVKQFGKDSMISVNAFENLLTCPKTKKSKLRTDLINN